MTWDMGSLTTSIMTLPTTFNPNSSLYTTSSPVTVSGEWAEQRFTCWVGYPGSTPINVNVTIPPAPGRPRPAGGEQQAGRRAAEGLSGVPRALAGRRLRDSETPPQGHCLCPQRAP